MKNIRTDFALERRRIAENQTIFEIHGCQASKIHHENHTYFSLSADFTAEYVDNESGLIKAIIEILSMLIPPNGEILVAALGNSGITADSLGAVCAKSISATRHIEQKIAILGGSVRSVAVIAPGVLGTTGIETAEIISQLCKLLRPCCVIVVDALAAASIKRLGKTIQISDAGITPGSGAMGSVRDASNVPLSEEFLQTKVISIGVPTVVDACAITDEIDEEDCPLIVTHKNADVIIANAARVISSAINEFILI
jgi:Germination protease.